MNFQCYIAMTAAEYSNCRALPKNTAWMACHFSCYGAGLSNLPPKMQDGSMLIINDKLPPSGHDPVYITEQLLELKESSVFSCILLDFQRESDPETAQIAKHISETMDCPVGISETYAHCSNGPVFINCPPPHCSLFKKLELWKEHELWLEAALETETAMVHRDRCQISLEPFSQGKDSDAVCDELRCRYRILNKAEYAEMILYRDIAQLESMLKDARDSGVTKVIGLYQQLGCFGIPIE